MTRITGDFGGSHRRLLQKFRPKVETCRAKAPLRVCRYWAVCSLTLLTLSLIFAIPAIAQSNDEVHIIPHPKPEPQQQMAPKGGSPDIDPTLKTHTRPMKVDVDLVLVPVTITDPMNRLVTGLEPDNFELFEGSEKQQIKHFSSEDVPISLGVIFDLSGSMCNKIEKSREAVVEFFRTANPQDEFFMVSFNDQPELLMDFTSSVEDIQAKLVYANPKGRTALMDAIYMGLHQMKQRSPGKESAADHLRWRRQS